MAMALYGPQGAFPNVQINFTAPLVPIWIERWNSELVINGIFGLEMMAALAIAFGWGRRYFCVLVWALLALLLNRNNMAATPDQPFIGWLLLAFALVPDGEPWRVNSRWILQPPRSDWQFPRELLWGAYLVMGASYLCAGFAKLATPAWLDGSAMKIVLQNFSLTKPLWREWSQQVPDWFFTSATYYALGSQLLAPLLLPFKSMRFLGWSMLISTHIFALILFDLFFVSLGMILFHLCFFDFDAYRSFSNSIHKLIKFSKK